MASALVFPPIGTEVSIGFHAPNAQLPGDGLGAVPLDLKGGRKVRVEKEGPNGASC